MSHHDKIRALRQNIEKVIRGKPEVVRLATVALLGQNGQAKFFLPIPNAISLVGVSFANQAIVFDPAANPAGLVASNAAEGVIGHR